MATLFKVVLVLFAAVPLLVASTVLRNSEGPETIQNNGVDLNALGNHEMSLNVSQNVAKLLYCVPQF